MKSLFIPLVVANLFYISACSQSENKIAGSKKMVGGGCGDCKAIYESPIPFEKLSHTTWLPDWKQAGTKLSVNGIVYKADGKTPEPGVIIYVYHTDQNGVYPTKGNEKGWAKSHGYLRGWMKTNEKGEYGFFTLRPAPYPGSKGPAHIHVIIKEPEKNEYWIDEYLFDDDPLLTKDHREKLQNRGGTGLLRFSSNSAGKGSLQSSRNIYLGKNIPDYH